MNKEHSEFFSFYKDRINACPYYGFKSGHEILVVIIRTAFWDSYLTQEEFETIMFLCENAHKQMMEDNYNEGWHE